MLQTMYIKEINNIQNMIDYSILGLQLISFVFGGY